MDCEFLHTFRQCEPENLGLHAVLPYTQEMLQRTFKLTPVHGITKIQLQIIEFDGTKKLHFNS